MGGRSTWWAVAAVVILAALDLLGAYLAKEFSMRPRAAVFAAGLATFAVLFVVYVKSLSVSDLWIVTFGWVVLIEVGVVLLERFHFGTTISPRKVVLAGILVIVQVTMMLPDSLFERSHPADEAADPAATAATTYP